ncbi:MAG: DUF4173 domain-containing protein [Clostridia bacterium]
MEKERVVTQDKIKATSLLVVSLLFGIWLREVLVGNGFGLSVLITVIVYYAIVFWYFDFNLSALNPKAAILCVPIVFLAAGFLLHPNGVGQFFAIPTLLGLVILQTIFLFDRTSKNFLSVRYVPMMFRKVFNGSVNGIERLFIQMKQTKNKKASSQVKYILIGLVIALPLVAILIALFSRADQGYADAITHLLRYFNINLSNIFLDLFFCGFFGFPLAACLVGLKYIPEKAPVTFEKPLHLNVTILATVLISLLLVALSFIAVQFQSLFFPAGATLFSRASTAIDGFAQITFASALLFAAITPVFLLAEKRLGKLPNSMRALIVLLSLSNLAILYSAVYRMSNYIADGGLSVKRFLTMWLMALIAVALVGVLVKCFVPRLGLIQFFAVTAILGVCFLNIINVDRTVAQFNISKYISAQGTYKIDLKQLGYLNNSILPDLRILDANMPSGKDKVYLQRMIDERQRQQRTTEITILNYTLNW